MKQLRFPGHLLRERREELGLCLDAVRDRVHVPVDCLRHFEEGNLAALPVKTYALGFLQSYCRLLGLDPEPFTAQYHACMLQASRSGRGLARLAPSPDAPPRSLPRWVYEAQVWGAVCAVIVLGWFAYTTVAKPLVDSWRNRAEAGTVEITPPVHFEQER